jgi:hypothetical protein
MTSAANARNQYGEWSPVDDVINHPDFDNGDLSDEAANAINADEQDDKNKTAFPAGLQFGAGLTIMPGHNWFIGYANKDFESFWWKRIGGRLDFTTPMSLSASATIHDKIGGGYEVDPHAQIWFKKFDFDKQTIKEDFDLDDETISLNGSNAKFFMKHKNFGALMDIYPFGNTWFLGGLRLSGGYYMGELMADFHTDIPLDIPAQGFKQPIGANDELRFRIRNGSKFGTTINWKYNGPYVGLGFDLGLLWGAKIYMDAGAVYTKPLKVSNKSLIDDKNIYVDSCFRIGASGACEWTQLFAGMTTPNVDQIVQGVLSGVIDAKIQTYLTGDQLIIPGAGTYTLTTDQQATIGQDITYWLLNGTNANTPAWITQLTETNADIANTMNQIRTEVVDDAHSDIQSKIDEIWGDYEQQKLDAVNDINDSVKDFRIMPMIKLGFMYRF